MKALKRIMLVALAAMALTMTGTMEAQAAKKPREVTKIEATKMGATKRQAAKVKSGKLEATVSLKFKKAKNAKKYQIRVYEAKIKRKKASEIMKEGKGAKLRRYQNTKKLAYKGETRTNKFTVKGLEPYKFYILKIRAVNGKRKGKWATETFRATGNSGIVYQGDSISNGKELERQYEDWKKYELETRKPDKTDPSILNFDDLIKCTSNVDWLAEDPNNYIKQDVCQTYKRGYGSDVEAYQLIMDICKDVGVRCKIVRNTYPELQDDGTYKERIVEGYSLIDLDNGFKLGLKAGGGSSCCTINSKYK